MLVTVKSADTAAMADIIARHAPSDAVIVSLQNGVGNAAVLRDRLPGRRVLGGMVPFNVIALGDGRFHRATSGDIVIEQDEARTAEKLSVPGLTMRPTDNIDGVQWGKLCSISTTRSMRWPTCRCAGNWRSGHGGNYSPIRLAEGLAAIRAEGIKPVSPTPIPVAGCRRCCACPMPSSNRCWGGR